MPVVLAGELGSSGPPRPHCALCIQVSQPELLKTLPQKEKGKNGRRRKYYYNYCY